MREMKESGIEIIGSIPKNWTISRLKYNLREPMKYGATETGEDYDPSLYRYIRITDITADGVLKEEGKLSLTSQQAFGYILRDKTVLFARSGGTVGKSFLYKASYGPSAFAGYLISGVADERKMLPEWLMYFTNSSAYWEWVNQIFTQATIQNISADKYSNMPIAIAPIVEQKSIVAYLDAKCAKIDALSADIQSEIDTLEAYKRSVITEAVTKGLDKNVPMKDSGIKWIGKMPISWNIIRGKYILKYLQKPIKEDDGVITCFRDGEVTLRSNRREDGFTMSDKEIGYQGIDIGDLVVHGMDGFAGAIGISDSRGKASPVLNVLDTDENKKYIMYYLRSMAYSDVFLALATGIRVRSCDLRWNKLAELFYPVPSRQEQDRIVQYIDTTLHQADEIITKKKEQLTVLADYKKSIIYEYVTGKKEVPSV